MKKKQKTKKKKPGKVQPTRRARTPRLPGMENAGIPELERAAEALNDVRQERMGLTKREKELADDLLVLMKKHKKFEYHHEDVHAWREVEVTDEKVKVKIGPIDDKKAKKIAKAATEAENARPTEPESGAGEQAQAEGDAQANAEATGRELADEGHNEEEFEEEEDEEEVEA